MTGHVNVKSLTEDEKIRALKAILGSDLPKDMSSADVDGMFARLGEMFSEARASGSIDLGELGTITVESISDDVRPFKDVLYKEPSASKSTVESQSLLSTVKSSLAKVPWSSLAAGAVEIAVFGAAPQTLAIMVGMELLMRVRFGSLFRGGAQAIQLVMNNLNKTGVLEVTEEAGKKAAEVMMEVIKAFTVHPEKAVIKVAGKASEFLSGVAQKMGSLAKEAGFGFVSEVVGHHSIEQKREEQVAEAEYRSPTPFRTAPTPLAE